MLLESIKKLGGTLTVLRAPLEIKEEIDVFGELTSAYSLMVRIKQQFDPKGILARDDLWEVSSGRSGSPRHDLVAIPL